MGWPGRPAHRTLNMEIRSYDDGDLAAVIALWDATGLSVNPLNDPAQDIELCRTSGHGDVLVGEIDGELVATVMVGHDGHRGWYYYLATSPDRQRQGLGREIVAAAEDWLTSRKLPKVEILVRDINIAAMAFYQKLGYVHEPVQVLSRRLDGREHKEVRKTVQSTVTYLEMQSAPERSPVPSPAVKHAVLRSDKTSVAFYRYLFDNIGEDYNWTDVRLMSDEDLADVLNDENVDMFVLYVDGEPAGFAQLDRRTDNDIELLYFGIMPHFIGRRLGPWLLDWTIRHAWSLGPDRVWLHTCDLDHPRALPMYQKAGFNVYDQQIETEFLL
jgi:GNAT superfamily N-acetyltransferase